MPIIYKCGNCQKETTRPLCGWLIQPQIGGTKVLCPDCRIREELKNIKPNKQLDAVAREINRVMKKSKAKKTAKKIKSKKPIKKSR